MLTVFFKKEVRDPKTQHWTNVCDWHLGEPLPMKDIFDHVERIQADGDELHAIKLMFSPNGAPTIPFTTERVQGWYGDIARTIFINLRNTLVGRN